MSTWHILGQSVQGAAHKRSGLPNQDALLWLPESGYSQPPVMAFVSDGHGSPRCFRSQQGSRLAVQAASQVMQEFLAGQPDLRHFSAIKRTAEERLPQAIIQRWREAVRQNWQTSPCTQPEQARFLGQGEGDWRALEQDPALAYGATLLAALASDEFILCLQLGDGDILSIAPTGDVSRPLPGDRRLMGNQTTSLCSPGAVNEFRVAFQCYDGLEMPALLLLTTDGYANSFLEEAGFLQVGSDLLQMLQEEGVPGVQAALAAWLNEVSALGSGDDVTLAALYRP